MQSGSTDNLALKNADGDFWDWGGNQNNCEIWIKMYNIQYIEEGN